MPSRAAAAGSPSRLRTSPAPRRPARTRPPTARVTGLGGVFFRARDLDALADWYRTHLGLPAGEAGCTGPEIRYHVFDWRQPQDPERPGSTVWALLKQDAKYFGPEKPASMPNYRVRDLAALTAKLQSEGMQ